MGLPDEILHARSTLDLDAFKKDSDRGVAALRAHLKDAQAKVRAKKATCASPSCDREESLSAPLRACSQCHAARYCSPECQKADWKTHKKSCMSFEHLPICREFDPTLIHPGCHYSPSPIFASGHQDGIGCWAAPGGRVNCRLMKMPGAQDSLADSKRPEEDRAALPPDFLRKLSEIMPGPGSFLGVRVLVQNRTKEPVSVIGDEIIAAISPAQTQAFLDGVWDESEHERNVRARTVSGADAYGQQPCYCRMTHFNGKRVDSKEKKHKAITEEGRCVVLLRPTEHACFNVQYRLGSMERMLDFEAWALLDNITVHVARLSPALRFDQQSTLTRIHASVNHGEIDRWYADYKSGGELAFIASHCGQERVKMHRALRAAQDDDPILRYLEKSLKERAEGR